MAFCGNCGASVSSGSAFCNNCGQSVSSQATTATGAAVQPARVKEQTFFEGEGVLVTNTRLVRGNETFAMSGITSVSSFTEVPSKKGPFVVIAVGVLVFLVSIQSSLGAALVGVALVGLGIWWFRSIKDVYHVRLVTASGERDALTSPNIEYVAGIVGAINQAIVHRG